MNDYYVPTWATAQGTPAAKAYVDQVLDAPNPYGHNGPGWMDLSQPERDYVILTFDGHGLRDEIVRRRGQAAADRLWKEHCDRNRP